MLCTCNIACPCVGVDQRVVTHDVWRKPERPEVALLDHALGAQQVAGLGARVDDGVEAMLIRAEAYVHHVVEPRHSAEGVLCLGACVDDAGVVRRAGCQPHVAHDPQDPLAHVDVTHRRVPVDQHLDLVRVGRLATQVCGQQPLPRVFDLGTWRDGLGDRTYIVNQSRRRKGDAGECGHRGVLPRGMRLLLRRHCRLLPLRHSALAEGPRLPRLRLLVNPRAVPAWPCSGFRLLGKNARLPCLFRQTPSMLMRSTRIDIRSGGEVDVSLVIEDGAGVDLDHPGLLSLADKHRQHRRLNTICGRRRGMVTENLSA
mmetsp:Transcript_34596/g.98431  ORF Transcript_34596/g.98431 Transcript_34596/m.98431 type:complete len:314 (-) Transcript_34596:259-1200(-)